MPGFGMVKGHFCYDDESDIMTLTAPQAYSRIDVFFQRGYIQGNVSIELFISCLCHLFKLVIAGVGFVNKLLIKGVQLFKEHGRVKMVNQLCDKATQLQEQGQKDVLAIIQQLTEFKTVNEAFPDPLCHPAGDHRPRP